jgi:cytochrome P450
MRKEKALPGRISTATVTDTGRVLTQVLAPTLAAGVIKRRINAMGLLGKLRLDTGAVALLGRLRERYGPAPLRLRIPGRSVVLPLAAADVGRLLEGSPDPFSPATLEKRAALRHFQPHGVLISRGALRARRREFNDTVLEPDRPLHELAEPITAVIHEEAVKLLDRAGPQLGWDEFAECWWRIVRRSVLGDSARDDHRLTDVLAALRYDGNWAYLRPRRRALRESFDRHLRERIRLAEPDSLAARVASTPESPGVDAEGQLPHWLFAFDAAGMATFRTLALLAAHPRDMRLAREEITTGDRLRPQQLPLLRASVLESVRLWPTTPALLRESTADTGWGRAGTTFLVFTPFFHRDAGTLPYADRFAPGIWLDGRARQNPALVPFSAGPGQCPGRNLVLFTASTMLAVLLREHDFALSGGTHLDPEKPLPHTLDNFRLRFDVRTWRIAPATSSPANDEKEAHRENGRRALPRRRGRQEQPGHPR